jgi:hypothetical protein
MKAGAGRGVRLARRLLPRLVVFFRFVTDSDLGGLQCLGPFHQSSLTPNWQRRKLVGAYAKPTAMSSGKPSMRGSKRVQLVGTSAEHDNALWARSWFTGPSIFQGVVSKLRKWPVHDFGVLIDIFDHDARELVV